MKFTKFGKYVEVLDNRDDKFSDKKVSINWSAIGSVSVIEAKKFSIDLAHAIDYVKVLEKTKGR